MLIIYSGLTLLWLLIGRVVLFLVFSCYFPFTNTISTDKTYSTAGLNIILIILKEKTVNF